MHPAPSLIVFTTLSGLGFGLLAWLGLAPNASRGVSLLLLALAYALCLSGLAASALHLKRRERALKAFSQWRTSWLSREAWAALVTLLLAGGYALSLLLGSPFLPLGWLMALGALGTIFCTAMIYAQLKSVPRWHHPTTPGLFLAYAATGGALLSGHRWAGMAMLVLTAGLQIWVWIDGDRRLARSGTTLASATGLAAQGSPRAMFPPHTGSNYLLREMGFVVARRHALKLRMLALVMAFLLPLVLLALGQAGGPKHFSLLCLAPHIAGVFLSRWLFFAEAEHVMGLYYGR